LAKKRDRTETGLVWYGIARRLAAAVAATESAGRDFVNILTDVSLPLERGAADYLGTISYAPSAQYRRVAMTGSDAISQLSFSVYFKLRLSGQLILARLNPGASLSLKLLFERR